MSKIKDAKMAGDGELELAWARANMPALMSIRKRFEREKPFRGLRIGVALHLEKKTGILLETLKAGGASVAASSCNPLTTDDRVAAALAREMEVYAWEGESASEYDWCLNKVLDSKPDIVIDDGCDLILLLHDKRKEMLANVRGACEETTTGVRRLKAMEREGKLKLPVIAVNDAYSKFLFDNRFGTGQSTVDAIMRATNVVLAGKRVVVVGFGWCGRGIAERMKGMGARVIVVEAAGVPHEGGASSYHRALEASYSGYDVMPLEEAARIGDIFVTATGNKHVIAGRHFELMKDGAIVANAGHFDVEIDAKGLREMAKKARRLGANLEEFELKNGRKVRLLSEGRLVNLARPSGQGHPIEIMDASFALQALCAEHIAAEGKKMLPAVHSVLAAVDENVARLVLEAKGIYLENMSAEQARYANSWKEGTE
ncbi:MAG: adenosylhomocysteinase [Candidatus Burarchaeum sp.]|nr:adenosylhomocysteinase [Candidatus Burarchaeum sp.]MDO8339334.1 adenosylhomocysteinase [Candidatus Burarchaeum sp.]